MVLRFHNRSFDLSEVEIETTRLCLRQLHHAYTREIFENFTPEITKYMVPKPAGDIAETEAFVDGALLALARSTDLHLVICHKDTGEFLGICGLHSRDDSSAPELGIWIKKAAHGSRFGLEAMDALVSWASDNLDCDRFIYPVDRRNVPSRAIAERLAGSVISEIEVENMSGRILDEVVYGIPLKSTGRKSTER